MARFRTFAATFTLLGLMLATDIQSQQSESSATTETEAIVYELVVEGGRVIDPETKLDEVRNVGISGGWIVKISKEPLQGRQKIHAEGLIVSPGFIDTHQHSSVQEFGVKLALRDGVTTPMDFEMGAREVDKWYSDREGKWQANFGTTVSQELWRSFHLDQVSAQDFNDFQRHRAEAARDGESKWATHVSSHEEMNKILSSLDEGLRHGAIGIGSLLGYCGDGVTAREEFETQKVGANYGRLTAVHLRYSPGPPPYEFEIAAQEVIANAFLLDAPLLIQHFNNDGWPLIHEMMVRARKRGMNVWGELYPYRAGSSSIGSAMLRPEPFARMGLTYEKNMFDPLTGKFFTKKSYLKTAKDDPSRIIVIFVRPEEWLNEWVKLPGVVMASDAMMPVDKEGKPVSWDAPYKGLFMHPRSAGAHAKWLRLGRENKVPLVQLISHLSYNSAKHLGDTGLKAMKVRGRIQEGCVADITIFDFDKVTDHATYKGGEGGLPSTGIPYVIVNGSVVVEDSIVKKGVYPGKPIRFPVEQKGRFESLRESKWRKVFQIPSIQINGADSPTAQPSKKPTQGTKGTRQSRSEAQGHVPEGSREKRHSTLFSSSPSLMMPCDCGLCWRMGQSQMNSSEGFLDTTRPGGWRFPPVRLQSGP